MSDKKTVLDPLTKTEVLDLSNFIADAAYEVQKYESHIAGFGSSKSQQSSHCSCRTNASSRSVPEQDQ